MPVLLGGSQLGGGVMAGPLMPDFTYSFRGIGMRSTWSADPAQNLIIVQKVKGLSPPSMRIRDTYRSLKDGDFPGLDSRTSRAILLHAEVLAPPGGTVEEILTPLRAAFAPTPELWPFAFKYPGLPTLVAFCRGRHCNYDLDERYALGNVTVDLELYAPDPNLYDDPASSVSTAPYASQGGLAFPLVFPLAFAGVVVAGSSGVVMVNNQGNMPSPAVLTIHGYAERPLVENVTTGTVFELLLNLGGADTIVADAHALTIVLGGGADYLGAKTDASDFIVLQPGMNEIHFHTRGVANSDARLTVGWRNAWA